MKRESWRCWLATVMSGLLVWTTSAPLAWARTADGLTWRYQVEDSLVAYQRARILYQTTGLAAVAEDMGLSPSDRKFLFQQSSLAEFPAARLEGSSLRMDLGEGRALLVLPVGDGTYLVTLGKAKAVWTPGATFEQDFVSFQAFVSQGLAKPSLSFWDRIIPSAQAGALGAVAVVAVTVGIIACLYYMVKRVSKSADKASKTAQKNMDHVGAAVVDATQKAGQAAEGALKAAEGTLNAATGTLNAATEAIESAEKRIAQNGEDEVSASLQSTMESHTN